MLINCGHAVMNNSHFDEFSFSLILHYCLGVSSDYHRVKLAPHKLAADGNGHGNANVQASDSALIERPWRWAGHFSLLPKSWRQQDAVQLS